MKALTTLPIQDLLLLRMALNDDRDNTDIAQDIRDLHLFPERLSLSYPDEWRAYIRRRLRQLHIDLSEVDTDNSINCYSPAISANVKLRTLITKAKPLCDKLLIIVNQIHCVKESSNVVPMQTPLHKWLAWVVS